MLVICVIVGLLLTLVVKLVVYTTFFADPKNDPIRDSKSVVWSEPWVLWSVAPLMATKEDTQVTPKNTWMPLNKIQNIKMALTVLIKLHKQIRKKSHKKKAVR